MTLTHRASKSPSSTVLSGDSSDDDGCSGVIRRHPNDSKNRRRVRQRTRRQRHLHLCIAIATSTSCITFLSLGYILLCAPPGKNYFQWSFWRRSHHLSLTQRQSLYPNPFPQNVQKNEYEVIPHPGFLMADQDRLKLLLADAAVDNLKHNGLSISTLQNLTVPTFWDPEAAFGLLAGGVREFLGNQGQYLITQEEAAVIGSFHSVTDEPTIFVAIASYRDPECLPTVESIFLRARSPDRIRVAIVDQRRPSLPNNDPSCQPPTAESCQEDLSQILCQYRGNIDWMEYSSELMTGPVLARHLAYRMYRGEYFALQVDSHVRFVADWDRDIISQWRSTGNEMAVLSTYMNDIVNSIDPERHQSKRTSRAMMCDLEYEWKGDSKEHIRFKIQPTNRPKTTDTPMLQPFWAAGFSFARGHFLVSVPYDPYLPLVFQGEEILQSIRGFTYGYDFYAPIRSVAFHIYATKENAKTRSNVPQFDENEILYPGAKKEAYLRLIGISGTSSPAPKYFNLDVNKFGLGQVRTRQQFFDTFGIHPDSKTIEKDLCCFVQGSFGLETSMQSRFNPFLRYDKMGIDYARITYQHTTRDPSDTPVDAKEIEYLRETLKRETLKRKREMEAVAAKL